MRQNITISKYKGSKEEWVLLRLDELFFGKLTILEPTEGEKKYIALRKIYLNLNVLLLKEQEFTPQVNCIKKFIENKIIVDNAKWKRESTHPKEINPYLINIPTTSNMERIIVTRKLKGEIEQIKNSIKSNEFNDKAKRKYQADYRKGLIGTVVFFCVGTLAISIPSLIISHHHATRSWIACGLLYGILAVATLFLIKIVSSLATPEQKKQNLLGCVNSVENNLKKIIPEFEPTEGYTPI
jgi:intracellular septation protein A